MSNKSLGNKLFKSGKILISVAGVAVAVIATAINSVENVNAESTYGTVNWVANDQKTIAHNLSVQGINTVNDLKNYKVVWGDTLDAIARHFNTTANELKTKFNISDINFIVSGFKMSDQYRFKNPDNAITKTDATSSSVTTNSATPKTDTTSSSATTSSTTPKTDATSSSATTSSTTPKTDATSSSATTSSATTKTDVTPSSATTESESTTSDTSSSSSKQTDDTKASTIDNTNITENGITPTHRRTESVTNPLNGGTMLVDWDTNEVVFETSGNDSDVPDNVTYNSKTNEWFDATQNMYFSKNNNGLYNVRWNHLTITGAREINVKQSSGKLDLLNGVKGIQASGEMVNVTVSGDRYLDRSKLGVYTVTYTATDNQGNTLSMTRRIHVISDSDYSQVNG